MKGADLARRTLSGRSRLSMEKGNSVACVADSLNLYRWRGPTATQARDQVFFPRAPLSLDLPQVHLFLIPSEKKKRAKRATRKKDSKGLLESLPYLVPKSPVNKRSGNKVLRSAGIIPFAICTTAKLLKR